jgi:hypothetical protein
MTQARFEDLPVWQTAAQLYEQTEELLEHGSFMATHGFGAARRDAQVANLKSAI